MGFTEALRDTQRSAIKPITWRSWQGPSEPVHDAVVNDDSMQVGGGRLVDRKLLEEGFGECSPYEFCCSVGSACYCEGLKLPGIRIRGYRFQTRMECISHWAVVSIGTFIPIIIAICILKEDRRYVESFFPRLVFALGLVQWIALALVGVSLLSVTNEGSISGMVAQRYNRIAYMTTLVIVCIVWSTSFFIVMSGVVRETRGEQLTYWPVALAAISPLVTSCILIFPIVVRKTTEELLMEPLDGAVYLGLDEKGERIYTMYYHRYMSGFWHAAFHYFFVMTGVGLGYISIIHALVNDISTKSPGHSLVLALFVLSVVSVVIFFVGRMLCGKGKRFFSDGLCCVVVGNVPDRVDRWLLVAEFLGLMWYFLDLILIAAITSGFVMDRF